MSEQKLASQKIEIFGKDGLALRQFVPEDAGSIFALIDEGRAHLHQFGDDTAAKYPSAEAVRESIITPTNPDKLRFGIWDEETIVGSINLTSGENQPVEVGYWVGKKHVGHSYATKALKLVSDYAFEQLDKDLLIANVAVGNEASRRSLEKAGFSLAETFQGRDGHVWRYHLTRSDINRLSPLA
ncbi:MAG: GNAT family N-acetyltransferase [bacterium]|nr:GNAT family N-acetyltransferase [bacterium]